MIGPHVVNGVKYATDNDLRAALRVERSKAGHEKAASEEAHRFCDWFTSAYGGLPYAFHKDVRTLLAKFATEQASHTPAVSVEGEKAADAFVLERDHRDATQTFALRDKLNIERKECFIAGFQARSPLVELLREVRLAVGWALEDTDLLTRIDKALGEEK